MSSDDEQQAMKPDDDDDDDSQLNPFDHQSYQSDNNLEEDENNDDDDDDNNQNETLPDDEDDEDEDNDQETRPDDDDDEQGTAPDKDEGKVEGSLKETGQKLIGKLTGKDNETDGDDDEQQNENETAPDDVNDDDEHNDNEEKQDNDSEDKEKSSKKSNQKKKINNLSKNMVNQLLGGDDEHQMVEEIHTKSSNDEDDDTEKDSKDRNDNSDEENDKDSSDEENDKDSSDEENDKKEKVSSDEENDKKDSSDEENDKSSSDEENEKNSSDEEDNKKEKASSDEENEKDSSDEEKENDELKDDFDDDGDDKDPSMMITEASNVIKPPKTAKERTGRRRPIIPPQPNYSDEEIIDQIGLMMKDKALPESSYHQPIRNYISREQLKASEQHDYKRAETLESYLDMLTDLLNQVDNTEQEEERRRIIESKIQKVNEQYQESVRRWNKEWNDKTQEQEKTKKSMEERQDLEIKDFKLRCSDDSFIQRFNKPSQTLINLRKAENQMAMSKLFDRAKALKKKADELQKIEQAEAQNKMNETVLTQYQLMDERHQRERECFEQHNRSIFETLEKKKEKERRAYELAVSMLKAQLDPPPNKDRVELVKPQTAKRPIRNNRTIQDIRSPAALDIKTVDFSKFTKTRKIFKPTTATTSARKSIKK